MFFSLCLTYLFNLGQDNVTLVAIAGEQDNTCADCGLIEGYCFPHHSFSPPHPIKISHAPVLFTLYNVHILLFICNMI